MEDTQQAKDQTARDRASKDTSEYSASKAPETRQTATEQEPSGDPRLLPGGAHRATAEVGMSEMNREDVPNEAARTGLVHYGDTQDEDPA